MLADPQTITITGTALTLPRVLTGTELGRFSNGTTTLETQTSRDSRRVRTVVRLKESKVTTDPLVSTTNIRVDDTIALNITRPVEGFSDADVLAQVKGFIAWLSASTDENLKKIIAGEN